LVEWPPPPKRDDEACGIGGKPPKYQGDSGEGWGKLELSSMLRQAKNEAAIPGPAWDAYIRRAEELEEKAKRHHDPYKLDHMAADCFELKQKAEKLARQRDALAALCEEVIDRRTRTPGCSCSSCRVDYMKRRLDELTKKEAHS
jgi:hypothetical protein